MEGKVTGSPTVASFTLSAFEVKKVTLSKKKLEIEADRYGLHFFGALPYEDETKSFDKVKISKKPVHISIEREVIVVPKVKKDKKKKKDEPTPQQSAAAQILKTREQRQPRRRMRPLRSPQNPLPRLPPPKPMKPWQLSPRPIARW